MPKYLDAASSFCGIRVESARSRPVASSPARSASKLMISGLVSLLFVTGCGGGDGTPKVGGETPLTRPSDALLEFSGLTGLASSAAQGDVDRLLEALQAPEGAARARAAFSFASLRDPRAVSPLAALLGDPLPLVRADAAFALGEYGLEAEGAVAALAARLAEEEDSGVRERMVRALGQIGGEEAARSLLALGADGDDAGPRSWALATIMVRGTGGETEGAVLEALAAALQLDASTARDGAAWGFWRVRNSGRLAPVAAELAGALQHVPATDSARGWLVATLLSLDPPHVINGSEASAFLSERETVATRVLALRALEAPRHRADSDIRALVYGFVGGTVTPIAMTAAETVAAWGRTPQTGSDADQAPGAEWGATLWLEMQRTLPGLSALPWQHLKPLFPLAVAEDPAWVRGWIEGEGAAAGVGLQHAVRALRDDLSPESEALLFRLSNSEPLVRAAVVDALRGHWEAQRESLAGDLEGIGRYAILFADEVATGAPVSAIRAARPLLDPLFQPLQTVRVLEEAVATRYRDGHPHLIDSLGVVLAESRIPRVLPLLNMLAESPVGYRVRRSGDRALQRFDGRGADPDRVDAPDPEYPVDWRLLASIGPRPELEIETTRGTLRLVLDAEQAPQTVQAIMEQASQGLHDGTHFHRVVPNFVIQAGDVSLGDGTGGPGYQLRTETTWIPFVRGVIGMASAGRNTEGSQWFITHSRQPHLDGVYTAFGWVISGWEVLDGIVEGDRVIRMRVNPDPQWFARF
jgi:cyclophilin family peptidyl-prolyl cis-trans isomerase